MGNSSSSPSGQANASTTSNKSNKQDKSSTTATATNTANSGTSGGSTRGSHSNIPIQSSTTTSASNNPRLAIAPFPYIPTTQHRPAPPPHPAQPRPDTQQQHLRLAHNQQQLQGQQEQLHRPAPYQPSPFLAQSNINTQGHPRPQQPDLTSNSRPMRNNRESSSSSSNSAGVAVSEDDIPTVVLQEQLETMLIDIATAESRVRELREELDTFESHPIFSSMMLAWFLSFNLSDYSLSRIEDLKRDALKAWQPVLNSFMQDGSSDNITEIDARLFDSIIQDVISHADMIAGSTETPENLILSLKRIAHNELDNARRSLEQNRIAFQECQITLQARGAVPTAVLEMQRSIEEEQRKAQEAKRANEQRQREIVAERQRVQAAERLRFQEEQRKREEEEKEKKARRDREREERQKRELEERQRKERGRQEEEIRLKALAAARNKVATRPPNTTGPSTNHAASHAAGRPKAATVSVPGSYPVYETNFSQRMHADSPAAYSLNISEEQTVVDDSSSEAGHLDPYNRYNSSGRPGQLGVYSPIPHAQSLDDGEIPSTPLLRRNRPLKMPEPAVPGIVPKSPVDSTTIPCNQYGYPTNSTVPQHQLQPDPPGQYTNQIAHSSTYQNQGANIQTTGPEIQMQIPMPMPMPYVSDFSRTEYPGDRGLTSQAQDMQHINHSAPHVPESLPTLYPPQIISEDELKNRLALEQLEQIKQRNDEILRDIQEQQRIHAITIKNLELQGHHQQQQPSQHGYQPYSHPGVVHDGSQEGMHAQNKFQGQTSFMSNQGYPQHAQHQHGHQHGYAGYQGEYVTDSSAANFIGPAMNGQESTHQGDMYNYQHYQGYNHGNMTSNASNWNPQLQQYSGFIHQQQQQYQHQHQHQQHQQQQQQQPYQYPSSLTPAQIQLLQQQQQYQQQLQMSPEESPNNGYADHRLSRVQSVSYSTSPYGNEYDFGPVEIKVGGIVRLQQPIEQQPTEQHPEQPMKKQSPLVTPDQENNANSADVLPQIRAKPPNLANRRAPQVILSEEQQAAAAKALREMNEEEHEMEAAANIAASEETVTERGMGQQQPIQDQPLLRPSPRPKVSDDAIHRVENVEMSQSTPTRDPPKPEGQETIQYRIEDEDGEDEEETLQRRVRRMQVTAKPVYTPKPTPIPVPPSSHERKKAQLLTPAQQDPPVPAPRPSPRPSLRPAPRPTGGMTRASQEPLTINNNSLSSVSFETRSVENETRSLTPTEPSVDTNRLSLHRSPSSPPAVPKKPVALRSPRRNNSEDDRVEA
ncbi:hypothetical protein FBU30_002344 [Linnemannia zychae]|nr:hypothetical protein FBU30_002344 [Linnemannia zychae]